MVRCYRIFDSRAPLAVHFPMKQEKPVNVNARVDVQPYSREKFGMGKRDLRATCDQLAILVDRLRSRVKELEEELEKLKGRKAGGGK